MNDPGSLERAFDGVHGVFTVQNHHISGHDGELAQATNVTDVALRSGVRHVVYGAAGVGRADTGVGSWGRAPRRYPLPVRLFEWFVGTDETTMWGWLRANEIDLDTGPTLELQPEALSVRAWLERQRAQRSNRAAAQGHGPG